MNVPAPDDAQALHDELVGLLDAVGPRPSCSDAERDLGRRLSDRWARFADEVHDEAFTCHPHAFLASIPLASALALLGAALLTVAPAATAALTGVGGLVLFSELLRYHETLDPLFPAAEGTNVVATLHPTGDVRQRIVVSAHQDSAWEFVLWYRLGQAAIPAHALALLGALVPFVASTLAAAGWLDDDALRIASWATLALAPFVAAHLAFHLFRPVLGAMDDLAGLVVVGAAGRALARERLAHTEVVLLACSAEECGLRGAKRYAAAHADEHAAVPTVQINVDGVYDEAHLSAVTRELTLGVRHDDALVALAEAEAAAMGRDLRRVLIPFGATDASAFAQAGVRTVSLLAQDTERLAPNYHTRRDTPDHVRPTSLATMVALVERMARTLDAGLERQSVSGPGPANLTPSAS